MTTAQKNWLHFILALSIACVPVVFTAGWVRREIDSKEDRVEHDTDMATERSARLLQHVHDSAFSAVILDRVNDIACAQNPSRRYCR